MKRTLLSLALTLFCLGTGFAQSTTLDLSIENLINSNDPMGITEVNLTFNVLPDSMGTGNEMGSGWDLYEPIYSFDLIVGVVMTTEYYWYETLSVPLEMYVAFICEADTTILPPYVFTGIPDTEGNVTYSANVEVGCGDGDTEWDCPNLNGNVGDSCQNGWGTINDNCECVVTEENCLAESGIDYSNLFLYYLLQCGDEDNLDAWVYCGLIESLDLASLGNTEACEEIQNWIDSNNWDGTWTPEDDVLNWSYGDDVTLICNGDLYDDTPITITSEEYDNPEEMDSNSDNIIDEGEFIWYLADLYDCYAFNIATLINWNNIYIEPENCLEGLDSELLLLYAIMECGNPDNLDAWMYCGLAESIAAANAGDEEACADVWAWVEANDWDGTWEPGNGGNDLDCPELGGNIGDWCSAANGGLGEISADCECIEIPDCDLTVETNLLSIDDGTGSGSVEAIASGGTPPYVYIWTDFWDEQLLIEVDSLGGTGTTLDSVPADTYFLQVTDASGCVAFGWEDVPTAWDCPELEANIGDFCGNGNMLQIVSEDCQCVDYEEPNACVADFTVVQAYNENEVIPFELFVFIWGYDDSNTYSWDFGDEGTSSDPFPTWTYGGSGPYNLCLTVSNEEEDCITTSCEMLEIDSLGWINGFMDGFSITIMNGEDGVVNGIDEQSADDLGFNIVPNPVVNGSFGLNWEASSAGLVDITMLSMDGSVVLQTTRNRGETDNAQSINVEHLAPGLYLCQIRQNGSTRSEKVVIR